MRRQSALLGSTDYRSARTGGLLEDSALVVSVHPVQFGAVWYRRVMSPELELAQAILEEAISDLRNFRNAQRRDRRRLYTDAYNWFVSNDRRWVFSFLNICELLGLSSRALRERLVIDTQPTVEAA